MVRTLAAERLPVTEFRARLGPQSRGKGPKLRVTGRDLNKNLSVHLSTINSRPDHEADQSAEERAQRGVLDYGFKRDMHRRSPWPRWINGLQPRSQSLPRGKGQFSAPIYSTVLPSASRTR